MRRVSLRHPPLAGCTAGDALELVTEIGFVGDSDAEADLTERHVFVFKNHGHRITDAEFFPPGIETFVESRRTVESKFFACDIHFFGDVLDGRVVFTMFSGFHPFREFFLDFGTGSANVRLLGAFVSALAAVLPDPVGDPCKQTGSGLGMLHFHGFGFAVQKDDPIEPSFWKMP